MLVNLVQDGKLCRRQVPSQFDSVSAFCLSNPWIRVKLFQEDVVVSYGACVVSRGLLIV